MKKVVVAVCDCMISPCLSMYHKNNEIAFKLSRTVAAFHLSSRIASI